VVVVTGPLRIGFCGLGRMGFEMVATLAERDFPVTVWNRTPERAARISAAGDVRVAATPAQAAKDAHVVITMLTDGEAVLATLGGPDGILAGAAPGTVVVDCSTTGAEAARIAADRCAAAGVRFLDSPVSGSTVVARKGQLGLMVGGEEAVLDTARPVLEALGTVVHVGPTGAGAAAKVAVNALLHTFSATLAECLVAARAAGVSAEGLFDVLAAGVLWNRFLDYKRPAFTDPDSAPVAFDLRTATKDLGLAVRAEREAGLPASVVRCALEVHRRALDDGLGDRDMSALASWFSTTAGQPDHSPAAGASVPVREPERN
jgi:3-hydroxyisobutyrate dehydrogenase-like beta-hydroxyacid dehydrogenase